MKPVINIKRVYEEPSKKDGHRILIDGLWPRGIKKEEAAVDDWLKSLAPAAELRKWFGHDPKRWDGFQQKYRQELQKNETVKSFIEKYRDAKLVTLVYAAKDTEHNNAVALQQYLRQQFDKL